MADSPMVIVDSTYENVNATCPGCQKRNIFNRRSDLGRLRPVDRAEVRCEGCGQPLVIGGDLINSAYEMLLLDARTFLDEKRYMQAVLCAAQAHEVFFSHLLHVRLIYEPMARDGLADDGNDLKTKLYRKIEKYAFWQMRRVAVRCVVDNVRPNTLADAAVYIEKIDPENRVADAEIDALSDKTLADHLRRLRDSKVNDLRNKVVHKDAERPSREDAEATCKDAGEVLFPLGYNIGVQGTAEFYVNGGSGVV